MTSFDCMIWFRRYSALFIRFLMRFKAFRKYHFLLYKKFFLPFKLFDHLNFISSFNSTLKMYVQPAEWIQQHIFLFGVYEKNTVSLIQQKLPKDGVFIDIGANIGCHSLIAAEQAGKLGQVHAFEAIQSTFQAFKKNIELNDFKNIHANHLAIYNKETTIELFLGNADNMGMSSVYGRNEISSQKETVQAITLDSYIENNQITRVDFIKIDIEGSELTALNGMKNTLSTFKPILLIEISLDILKETKQDGLEIYYFLKDFGYSMYGFTVEGNLIPTDVLLDGVDDYLFE